MVNSIQIIIHLPMLGIHSPQTVSLIYGVIVEIIQFNLIPTDKIFKIMNIKFN
jgi:hypothetical protein